eukprot:CAMPEP_0114479502 /NCGR_PEP_ID=MMETSP0104-20121206/16609_1 /TAXON_ID=37642 ORGANISM="Paraphysomonas imperforata, Strain PA2" /NCGR_SAMPLE_ID=MMETSP0104 /ASSEMBLY_ACC=CAM_ASM_000202 /LENGTH=600 /DNA_ID=CAMNT_0001654877 /DNA_START=718 /DNA_END=2516 /DNA_ORIENTATION=+
MSTVTNTWNTLPTFPLNVQARQKKGNLVELQNLVVKMGSGSVQIMQIKREPYRPQGGGGGSGLHLYPSSRFGRTTCNYKDCSRVVLHEKNIDQAQHQGMCPLHRRCFKIENELSCGPLIDEANEQQLHPHPLIQQTGQFSSNYNANHAIKCVHSHYVNSDFLAAVDVDDGYAYIQDDVDLDQKEGPGNNLNPDEIDEMSDDISLNSVDSDNLSEANDLQQHLLEIGGAEVEVNEDDYVVDSEFFDDQLDTCPSHEELQKMSELCRNWAWSINYKERQAAVFNLSRTVHAWVLYMSKRAEGYIDEARRERAEASGRVLKNAVLIGGTVVGAANRLMALRASDPFAIIVEEACEVMEPTLMAVLSVPSVQKIQLIGDHRQLPAFVSNCWYDVASTSPALKISLFERLVQTDDTSQDAQAGICSVLDVQRRMRPEISDLTKCHYSDVVNIQDHQCTETQRMGDKIRKNAHDNKKDVWECRGSLVPGVSPSVYFWNVVNNRESRNKAGISACNEIEADFIVGLVGHLLRCGVDKSSISVITPYSGQKRLLVKKMMDAKFIVRNNYTNSNHKTKPPMKLQLEQANSVLVSTVDRYQGDENDIVIL